MIGKGQKGRDKVTGYEGIVIGITDWLSGCFTIGLQAPIDKDGKKPDVEWFDEPRIEVVKQKAKIIDEREEPTGGPILDIPKRNLRGQ